MTSQSEASGGSSGDASGGSGAWDRVLGVVMGIFAGALLASLAAYGVLTLALGDRARDAARRSDLGVAADLRALAEALQASDARRPVGDAEASRLIEDMGAGTLLRLERPPGALKVTLELGTGSSSLASTSTKRCADVTVPVGAGAAGKGFQAPVRDCQSGESAATTTQPPASTSTSEASR